MSENEVVKQKKKKNKEKVKGRIVKLAPGLRNYDGTIFPRFF